MSIPSDSAKCIEKIVSDGTARKYHKIAVTGLYGGSLKAYCVGCNLSCNSCQEKKYNKNPEKYGKLLQPKDVAQRLTKLSKKKGISKCIIGGGEPTLNWQHLVETLRLLSSSGIDVIIETNGIMFGYNDEYAKQLSDFKGFVQVKVRFRGACPEEFAAITGSKPELFELQIFALKNLSKSGVQCNPVVLKNFSRPETIERLMDRLETISPSFYDIEEETLPAKETNA